MTAIIKSVITTFFFVINATPINKYVAIPFFFDVNMAATANKSVIKPYSLLVLNTIINLTE